MPVEMDNAGPVWLPGWHAQCSYESGNFLLPFARAAYALSEHRDHLTIECRKVIRFAAGHQSVIADDLFIHPITTRILDVCLKRRPGSDGTAAGYICFHQHPRTMADG